MSDAFDLKAFDQWLTVQAFEDLFWSLETHILKNGRWIDAQHPKKPYGKFDNELFALLLLAKHEVGARRNWDLRLEVRANIRDIKSENFSFDAQYRVKSLQPDWLDQDRSGLIEVVRGMTEKQSLDLRTQNEILQREGSAAGGARDMDDGVATIKAAILDAVRKKSAKTYATGTGLVVWLRGEANPKFAGYAYSDSTFLDQVRKEATAFAKLCIVGVSSGCRWVKGTGL